MTKPLLLSKAIEGFMLACQARKLSKNTVIDYRRTLKKFLSHLGDVPVATIESVHVTAFLACQTVGEKTILNYHIGLSSLWTWLVKQGYVEKHVMRLVDKPKPKKVAIEPFTQQEIKAMLESVRKNNERDRSLILLLLDTGLRASELCGINLKDLDLVNHRVKVLGKGNKERSVPFSSRTANALFRVMANADNLKEKLYPFDRTSLADLLSDIGKRAGIAKSNPHRFRHTFAISYLRNGGDPFTLMEILGHTTMEMVNHYLKLAQVDIDTAHKRASPVENWKL